jgi:hemerythrin-like domain-containing protein
LKGAKGMPIVIGEKRESDFTDPIGLLGDCHRRIVRFLHVLVALATQEKGGPLSDEQRTLLSTSLRYFRDAAPKHTADEEESLFPRLRRCDSPEIDAVLAQIDSLEQDHECADRSHAEVDRLGQLWLTCGRLASEDAVQFERLVGQLETLYRHHIGHEDTELFPFAARVLTGADRLAIGREMAARRGLGALISGPAPDAGSQD